MVKVVALCVLLCAASTLGWAGGTMTYYVAPNGADGNDGSATRPFATIQKAVEVVSAGDTVIVRDGVYTVADGIRHGVGVNKSGTAEKPIAFKSEHKWGAVLDGKNYTTNQGWSFGKHASYLLVEGFEVRKFRDAGFDSNGGGAHHITIRGNHVHHIGNIEMTTEYGINGAFDDDAARYHIYDANEFHDIGRTGPPQRRNLDHGIYTCGKHTIITNNIFYDCNSGWGIQVAGYQTVDDITISNNVFAYGHTRGQIILWQPCHNVLIQNNIFYKPAVENAINFLSNDLQNITIRNNLVFGGGLMDDHTSSERREYRWVGWNLAGNAVGLDPLFADAAKHDFRLKPGSPAIDAGVAEHAPKADIDGKPRSQGKGHDIGAYER